jgi:hypothetical protein
MGKGNLATINQLFDFIKRFFEGGVSVESQY